MGFLHDPRSPRLPPAAPAHRPGAVPGTRPGPAAGRASCRRDAGTPCLPRPAAAPESRRSADPQRYPRAARSSDRSARCTGGKWEGLFLRQLSDGAWELLCRTCGRPILGEAIDVEPGPLRLRMVGRTEGHWLVRPEPEGSPADLLPRHGRMPLPPYIHKGRATPADAERYQTVFAQHAGAVAAPTAGLHFTPRIFRGPESARHWLGVRHPARGPRYFSADPGRRLLRSRHAPGVGRAARVDRRRHSQPAAGRRPRRRRGHYQRPRPGDRGGPSVAEVRGRGELAFRSSSLYLPCGRCPGDELPLAADPAYCCWWRPSPATSWCGRRIIRPLHRSTGSIATETRCSSCETEHVSMLA